MKKLPQIFLVVFIILSIFFVVRYQKYSPSSSINPTPTPLSQITSADQFSYCGQSGIDALTLLKNQVKVEVDNSGLVVSINGRQADSNQHEYWAFYINNQMASVGPASYKTTDADIINWKIEKY